LRAISRTPPSSTVLGFRLAQGMVLGGGHMQRREFITLLGGAAAVSCAQVACLPLWKSLAGWAIFLAVAMIIGFGPMTNQPRVRCRPRA
jgi:hypothetical protein